MTAGSSFPALHSDAARSVCRESMTSTKINPVVRLLPSLTDVAFLLPIVFLFVRLEGARTLLGDGDTGWHVRAGEWMLQNGRIPRTDFFSYSMPGQPWYAWEWLWELSFGWLHEHWGMSAVLLASVLVLCLTFALLFRLVRRSCGNAFVALGVTALAAAGSSVHWLARPHLFTLLFSMVFVWVIELASEGRTRLLWILPALMAVWVNVHGGFLAGLLILGAYAGGHAAAWLIEADAGRGQAALRQLRRFAWTALGCFAATFVNPYTYHLHVHVYEYLADPKLWQYISEFQALQFRGPLAAFTEPMFALAILSAARNLYRRHFAQAFLVLGWAHLALYSIRNLPIFLLLAAPAIAETLSDLFAQMGRAQVRPWLTRMIARFDEVAAEFGTLDRVRRWHVVSVAAVAILAAAFYAPAPEKLVRAEYDPSRYPAKALPLLRSADVHHIFTHDEWGDYLIYNLYPTKRVFVDGRSDFYGPSFDEQYMDIMRVKNGWEQTLARYSVDTILLPVDESLTGALKQSRKWRPVYDDGMAIVFRQAQASDNAPLENGRRTAGAPDSNLKLKAIAARSNGPALNQTPRNRS